MRMSPYLCIIRFAAFLHVHHQVLGVTVYSSSVHSSHRQMVKQVWSRNVIAFGVAERWMIYVVVP
jgi:hypothetical protein